MSRQASVGCAVLAALAFALLGGCPTGISDDLQRGPSTTTGAGSGTSTAGGSTGGQSVGPASPDGNDPNSPGSATTSGTGATTVAGGGTVGTQSLADALTTRFPLCQDPAEAAFWRAEVLRLVNDERRRNGLQALARNQTLETQAVQYACELIQYDFFDHVNPRTGTHLRDRSVEFGYDYWVIGENLAAGQRSPVEVVQAWLDSPCHRENIMNPAFTELGIGVRVGGDYGFYWVQEFGRPYAADPYSGTPYHEPGCTH
jgi:uncharacterized protein YkwD